MSYSSMTTQKEKMLEKYQISEGELELLNSTGEDLAPGLCSSHDHLNMKKLFEGEEEYAKELEYEAEKQVAEQEYNSKNFLKKMTSTKKYVLKPWFSIRKDIVRNIEKIDELLTKFSYQCDAHGLPILQTLQDHLILYETSSHKWRAEKAADAFRAYQRAKKSPAFN